MNLLFVIDLRHDRGATPTYKLAATWETALAIAGAFWVEYDGTFDPKARKPFGAGEGYEPSDLSVTIRRNTYLTLSFANGEGPCILIRRAEKPRPEKTVGRFDKLLTWANEKTSEKLMDFLMTRTCVHNTPPERLAQIFKFRELGPKTRRAILQRFFDRSAPGA